MNLVKTILDEWSKKSILTQTQEKLIKLQEENQKLKQQLNTVSTGQFVEEEARNKLFLVKPGERIVVLPSITPEEKTQQIVQKPYWQQWLSLFF